MKPAQHLQKTYSQANAGDRLLLAFAPPAGTPGQDDDSGGNPCLLRLLESAPSGSAPDATGQTLCLSWPVAGNGEPMVAVQCHTADGRAIQCCGHGLLATAYAWLQRLSGEKIVLLMGDSKVQGWRTGADIWLRFSRLPTTPCPVPGWTAEIFPAEQPPLAAASCGDERGYLVLQWPDDHDLAQLAPPGIDLGNWTRRALICTAAQPSAGPGAITLRYFAPQYGVAEDPATGSAMRVLADYWSPRFTRLSARQCSPRGGVLLARLAPGHVDVGGRCVSATVVSTDA